MKKLIISVVAVVGLAIFSDPAFARCADDLKAAKSAASRLPDAKKTERQAVKQKLDAADKALGDRDEHGCKAAVAEAQAIMK